LRSFRKNATGGSFAKSQSPPPSQPCRQVAKSRTSINNVRFAFDGADSHVLQHNSRNPWPARDCGCLHFRSYQNPPPRPLRKTITPPTAPLSQVNNHLTLRTWELRTSVQRLQIKFPAYLQSTRELFNSGERTCWSNVPIAGRH
jgi:hypothetical protein